MLNQTQHHRVRLYVPGDPRHTRPRPQPVPQEITVAEVHHHGHHQQQGGDPRAVGQKWRQETREGSMIPSKHSSQVTFKEDEKIVTWKAQRKNAVATFKRRMKKCDVNQVKLTPDQELTRFRLQFFCECLSLTTMVLAVIFVIITPFLLIPIWVIPNDYSLLLAHIMGIFILLSVVFLALTGILGNIYWYFDPKKNKWRCMLHCGKGPTDHFWGNTLFGEDDSTTTTCNVPTLNTLFAQDDSTATTCNVPTLTFSIPTNLEIAKFKNHMVVHDV